MEVKLKWAKGERSKNKVKKFGVNISQSFQICVENQRNQVGGVSDAREENDGS